LNRVVAPEGKLLSFASPKESNQRKGDPIAAYFLCSSLLSRAVLDKSSGARRGKREKYHPCVISAFKLNASDGIAMMV
jgi:hypothetical protein